MSLMVNFWIVVLWSIQLQKQICKFETNDTVLTKNNNSDNCTDDRSETFIYIFTFIFSDKSILKVWQLFTYLIVVGHFFLYLYSSKPFPFVRSGVSYELERGV
uniref:Uncharacterized protein n=1 Tax=Triticum urartu TaxID=4572 RepID=A0A8R7NXA8_TRIUA